MERHDSEAELSSMNRDQTIEKEYGYKGIHAESTIYLFPSLFT